MLHVRLIVPAEQTDAVVGLLKDDPTVANLAVLPQAAVDPAGGMVFFDLARENATPVLNTLRELGIDESGCIAFDESEVLLSQAALRAERAAPGRPVDAVIWESIEAKARDGAELSWSFAAFLVLATLIAGVGRYVDQPILIVGAMVVGPEFAPVSSICYALARPRLSLLPRALTTLLGGFAIATALATAWWWVAYVFGWVSAEQAAEGRLTSFIVNPDVWSFVIAVLAGTAGVLSLTSAKSSALVGVFISVTTVPAAGTIALSLAGGLWHEAGQSVIQLGVNLVGIVVAGTMTFVVQRVLWRRVSPAIRPESTSA